MGLRNLSAFVEEIFNHSAIKVPNGYIKKKQAKRRGVVHIDKPADRKPHRGEKSMYFPGTLNALRGAAAGVLLFATALPVSAAFPEKAITFIVPFGAGGGFDRSARALAPHLEKHLGVAIAIRNKPGAGGRKGSILLYKSKADGYTIGWVQYVAFLNDMHLFGKKTPIDVSKFEVIQQANRSSHYLYVGKKSPFTSVAALKKASRPVKFTATGVGSSSWIEALAFASAAGFKVDFITGYKSLTVAALAVAKGDGEGGIGSSNHFRGIADEIKPLVWLGSSRTAKHPNVPTAKEIGYPKLAALGSPRVVVAPPGTPKSALAVLRAAMKKATAEPKYLAFAKKSSLSIDPLGPDGVRKSLNVLAGIFSSMKGILKK